MARTLFTTAEALVIVSSDGYFDVFASSDRKPNERPAYRGTIAELGPTVRGRDGGLSVRPSSAILRDAVTAWSTLKAKDALRGALGGGRDAASHAAARAAATAAATAPAKG